MLPRELFTLALSWPNPAANQRETGYSHHKISCQMPARFAFNPPDRFEGTLNKTTHLIFLSCSLSGFCTFMSSAERTAREAWEGFLSLMETFQTLKWVRVAVSIRGSQSRRKAYRDKKVNIITYKKIFTNQLKLICSFGFISPMTNSKHTRHSISYGDGDYVLRHFI